MNHSNIFMAITIALFYCSKDEKYSSFINRKKKIGGSIFYKYFKIYDSVIGLPRNDIDSSNLMKIQKLPHMPLERKIIS